ncbi:MAG: ThuA domain-containing protein [Akkermansiaceae bacterium]|nr:ThuA domain-containing protein [Akkermansiaceae bacterium]
MFHKSPISLCAFVLSLIAFNVGDVAAEKKVTSNRDHLIFHPQGEINGKHIVLIAGDEEYRSEEAMPMMGEVLARHGFKCTVLFSMGNDGKTIDPNKQTSLSYPEALNSADMVFLNIRFRNWPDETMAKFQATLERGVAVMALRTSTHAFKIGGKSKYARYGTGYKGKEWKGGFGREVLGETWVNHHGHHAFEGCRARVETGQENNPIMKGVGEIFVTSDVYGANPKQPSTILMRGNVTKTLKPESEEITAKNNPAQPVVWTREYSWPNGNTNKVLTTTMGAGLDLVDDNLRLLLVNAAHERLGLPVPNKADASLPAGYKPSFYKLGKYRKGCTPEDFISGGKAHQMPAYPIPDRSAKK